MKTLLPLLALVGFFFSTGCKGPVKDFDVVVNSVNPYDANGLPLNPKWGAQAARNTTPNPKVSCPWDSDSDNPDDWTKSTKYPNCTSFPISFTGGFLCG